MIENLIQNPPPTVSPLEDIVIETQNNPSVEILNNKHIFNKDYPDYTLLWNTCIIHKLLYVDHQFSNIKNNETSMACTH